jgi:hypothetical protein
MEDTEFSPEFCHFLKMAVPSMEAAELLLQFHSNPGRALSIREAIAQIRPGIPTEEAEKCLAYCASAGLLAREGGAYRYLPDAAPALLVDRLAEAYTQRPVTLVRIIYALRDSKIQSFADAFKLRKG